MRDCTACDEELTVDEWEHFDGGLGPIEPWCFPCIKEEDQRMVNEEQVGYCTYRTLPRYLVLENEWD